MRTIKFRVWDGKYMDYDVWVNSCGAFGDSEKKYNTPNIEISSYHNKSIIMQFTGLHDKNGREIYEGDKGSYQSIIQNYEDDDCVNPRYYRTPQYETKTHNCIVKYIGNQFTIMDNSKWNELKIIGNIYENSELLNN